MGSTVKCTYGAHNIPVTYPILASLVPERAGGGGEGGEGGGGGGGGSEALH